MNPRESKHGGLEGSTVLSLAEFLAVLKEQGSTLSIEAKVDLSALNMVSGRRELADKVSGLTWEVMGYRFVCVKHCLRKVEEILTAICTHRYHSKYDYKRGVGDTTRFMYNCAQSKSRQHDPNKHADESKHRDKESMTSFACDGWLHLTVSDTSRIAVIKIQHDIDHVSYWTIDIPPEVDELIRDNSHLTVTQVRDSHCKVLCYTNINNLK